jgi:hypothetical protein
LRPKKLRNWLRNPGEKECCKMYEKVHCKTPVL